LRLWQRTIASLAVDGGGRAKKAGLDAAADFRAAVAVDGFVPDMDSEIPPPGSLVVGMVYTDPAGRVHAHSSAQKGRVQAEMKLAGAGEVSTDYANLVKAASEQKSFTVIGLRKNRPTVFYAFSKPAAAPIAGQKRAREEGPAE